MRYRSLRVFSLGRWSSRFHAGFLVSRATRVSSYGVPGFSPTGLLPPVAGLSRPIRLNHGFLTPRLRCSGVSDDPSTPCVQRLQAYTRPVWASPRSLAATWGISTDFFSSGYLDVSVRPVPSSWPIYSAMGDGALPPPGFPIRTSPDLRQLAAPRGFSQLTTSFIGSQRLGIHRVPFVA